MIFYSGLVVDVNKDTYTDFDMHLNNTDMGDNDSEEYEITGYRRAPDPAYDYDDGFKYICYGTRAECENAMVRLAGGKTIWKQK